MQTGFALLLGAEPTEVKYRGFAIDDSRIAAAGDLKAIIRATEEQIDIVWEVGLPDDILKFLQGVPFELVPVGSIARGSPGLYGGKERSVKVVSGIVAVGHKPVLLHELLHAFHDQKLKGGFRNPDVSRYFQEARSASLFEPKSHMMQNDREFFACAATTYLFGVTAQEPFLREKLKGRQPAFVDYLKGIFGPAAGAFAGSLTR